MLWCYYAILCALHVPTLTQALRFQADDKIIVIDLQTPWILCADCEWYEELGVCSTTGLVRVQPNLHWQQGCSLHNMANTFPVNVSYWPEVPFDPDHFDDKGEPKQNIKNGCYDFSGLTSVLDVINM